MSITEAVAVFISSAALDVTWARYTLMVAAKEPLSSAFWAMMIGLLSAVNIVAVANSPWYVIPTTLGMGVGTYFTMRHAKKNHKGDVA